MMIKFKNKTLKIIFYIAYGLLAIINLFMVIMAYLDPNPAMGLIAIIPMQLFCLLLPLWLLVILFTHPTPHKKRAEKQVRRGIWIPIFTFLALAGLASILMTIQSRTRCAETGPDGMLWDCDFSGADLAGQNLSGAYMTSIDLSGAQLGQSDLSNAKLSRADLSDTDLTGADLSNSDLSYANLEGADLTGTKLEGAVFQFANLVKVKGLTEKALAGLDNWASVRLQSEEEMLAQLWQVCHGTGVKEAAEYIPAQYFNSILIFTEEGELHSLYGGESIYASYWMPESVSNTELVACFKGPFKVGVGACTYDDGVSISKYMLRVEISIYAAQTGELIKEITLDGPRPEKCPENKVSGGDRPDYVGEAPHAVSIINALSPYVNEDGEIPLLNYP